jgi:hypothetical protein
MPNLGDYLGHLLSEITIARMHADLEALRVAELYAGHPLLKHMAVPHFRLPDVHVDVPVVIQDVEDADPAAPPRGAPTPERLRSAFDTVLAAALDKEGIQLKPQQKKKLKSVLDHEAGRLEQPSAVAVDVLHTARTLSEAALSHLRGPRGPLESLAEPQIERLQRELERSSQLAFSKLHAPAPRLRVQVTTGEIREVAPTELLTRLQLTIREEAVEWTSIESEGVEHARLVPE